MFPADEPLRLERGRTGSLTPFFVPIKPVEIHLRFIALWADNTPLGGASPTFGVKIGDGVITSVAADDQEVPLPGPKEGGTARCERLPGDTYLLHVTNLTDTLATWQVRITNKAAETLRFVWVSADTSVETLRPWMVLDGPLRVPRDGSTSFVAVRNWGTGPLLIEDVPGPLDGGASPASLVYCPAELPPHGVDHIALRWTDPTERAADDVVLEHTFTTNDDGVGRSSLRVVVDRTG